MAAGGFKFGQASATYDSASYTTKRAWARAVHTARCDAFFLAQHRAGGEWDCVETSSAGEISESRTVDTETYTLYIQDLHPISSDTTEEYPSFVTYFQHTSGAEYAIITSNGMTRYSYYETDITRGMYIHSNHLPDSASSSNEKSSFTSIAHSYADQGFSSYLFSSSSTNLYELPVLPLCGFRGETVSGSGLTVNDSYGMIYNPTNNVTYSFGYAIRDRVIECFYRTSQYNANTGWNWSIIGRIFSTFLSGNNIGYYSYYTSGREKDILNSNYYPYYSCYPVAFSCIDSSGKPFPLSSGLNSSVTRYPCLRPSFMPNRCNTSSPSDLLFSAGCLSLCQNGGTQYTETSGGIDGYGNCVAGIIDTDVLRIVARRACNVGGATYQGGNFVVPAQQICVYNCDDFGVLLGWDPSNESIV